jgi:hypothetical protein
MKYVVAILAVAGLAFAACGGGGGGMTADCAKVKTGYEKCTDAASAGTMESTCKTYKDAGGLCAGVQSCVDTYKAFDNQLLCYADMKCTGDATAKSKEITDCAAKTK